MQNKPGYNHWTSSARNSSRRAQFWSNLGRSWPKRAQVRRNKTKRGPVLPNFGRLWSKSTRPRSEPAFLAENCAVSVDSGQIWSNRAPTPQTSVATCPKVAGTNQTLVEHRRKLDGSGQHRHTFGRHHSNLVEQSPKLAELYPNLADFIPTVAEPVPTWSIMAQPC